jgi:S1-C subfamily serine protease
MTYRLALILIAFLAFTLALPAQDDLAIEELPELESRVAEVLRRVAPATVGLRYGDQPAGASAVIVSADGFVLTAAHCIPEVGGAMTVLLPDGREFAATALGKNDRRDFGLVKIDEKGEWPYAPMGRSSALEIEEGVLALGHPGGFDLERGPLVRFGWIIAESAPHGQFLRTSAKVRPGDSGGPLFDLDGRVIGIHSNISTPLDANYHIPVDLFLESWDRLVAKEHWDKGGLGARPDPWEGKPYAGLKARNLDEGGIEVTAVQKKAAASKAGVRPGDIILRVDGEEVTTWRRLARWLRREKKIGDAMLLSLRRGAEEFDLELTLLPKPGYEPKKTKAESADTPLAKGAPQLSAMSPERFVREFESALDLFDAGQERWRHSVVRFTSKADGEEREILGTVVVAERGLVLTKLSELGEELRAYLSDDQVCMAKVVARDENEDLALVRLAVGPGGQARVPEGLASPVFAKTPPAQGSFLITAGSRRRALGWGVAAVEPRRIAPARLGYLGIFFGDELPEGETGVLIGRIAPDGPAGEAGIRAGDVITRLNGEAIASRTELREKLRTFGPGAKLRLRLRRSSGSEAAETAPRGGGNAESSGPGKENESSKRERAEAAKTDEGGSRKIKDELEVEVEVELGERGNPAMNGGEPRVPNGLSLRRGRFSSAFRYDASLRPRDAGAPLFDLRGNCVGVLAARASRTHALVWPSAWLAPRVAAMMAEIDGK